MYTQIVKIIQLHATVLSELFADKTLTAHGTPKPSREIWEADLAMLASADAVIAEVTNPSLGVGYEIAKAEELKKPILCLYQPQADRNLSGMIGGSPYLKVIEYQTTTEVEPLLKKFIADI